MLDDLQNTLTYFGYFDDYPWIQALGMVAASVLIAWIQG